MIEMADNPVQDLWRIFRVMAEFTEGFEELASVGPAVSIFGSARTKPDDPYYKLAEQTAFILHLPDRLHAPVALVVPLPKLSRRLEISAPLQPSAPLPY